MMKISNILLVGMVAMALASCGSKKAMVKDSATTAPTTTASSTATMDKAAVEKQQKMAFVQKVYDQNLYQKNLVSGLSFTLNRNGKNISVPGLLHMRKDEVIRLQLLIPLLRSEVGRIEFTKDYVLFIDRIHKQYVKASYNDVRFLRDNGINFFSLQALFWNELFLPGQQKVGEQGLASYDVKLAALNGGQPQVPVMLQDGRMSYTWLVDNTLKLIKRAQAIYTSSGHGTSKLTWDYSDFQKFGSKDYPSKHEIIVETDASQQQKRLMVTLELDGFSDKADWETITTPSDKYQKVNVEDIIGKLMNL